MKRLFSYLKGYQLQAILAPLFKCLEACFELLVPLVVARMIDIGISGKDSTEVLKMGGILLLLAVIGLSCSITAQYFAAKVAIHEGTMLRNDLFRHINTLGYAEIDQLGTSTLITRMSSDTNQVQTGINMFLRLFMRSPFIVFGSMIMAFTIDVKAAVIFTVTIPLLALVVFSIMLYTMPLYRRVQKQLDAVTKSSRENLLGVRVVRAFNRQKDEMKVFQEENDRLAGMQVFVGKISALLNPLTYVIVNLAIVMLLLQGGKQVMIGRLTQGQVVALVNYMSQILVELIKLANLIILISKAFACMNRVEQIFLCTASVQEAEQVKKADISENEDAVVFDHVTFAYGSAAPSLKQISFRARRGETVGIIGGTGCGKTSLVHLIPRFYDVTEGSVLVNGQDVREVSLRALREKIGMVPQKSVLFHGSLRENMQWGYQEASDEEIFQALETAQAAEFVREKAEGLELMIEQGGRNLSGGQRQRLAIARALVRKPEILILDDSASALDFATDAALRRAIRESTKNMTVFLISQRASTVRQADQILVLDDGELVGIGTHETLLKHCEVYREICISQLSAEEVEHHG